MGPKEYYERRQVPRECCTEIAYRIRRGQMGMHKYIFVRTCVNVGTGAFFDSTTISYKRYIFL